MSAIIPPLIRRPLDSAFADRPADGVGSGATGGAERAAPRMAGEFVVAIEAGALLARACGVRPDCEALAACPFVVAVAAFGSTTTALVPVAAWMPCRAARAIAASGESASTLALTVLPVLA